MLKSGMYLSAAAAALATLGDVAKDTARDMGKSPLLGMGYDIEKETLNGVPMYHIIDNAPNNRRRKVKDARKQNVQRLIRAKRAS